MAKLKYSSGKLPQKDPPRIQTVSDPVVFSCYLASLVILVIAIIEALKQFQLSNFWGGILYIVLAIAGISFSVFITLWNRRNKQLLKEQKKK